MKFYELTVDTVFQRGDFKGKMSRVDFWLNFLFTFLWLAIFFLIFTGLSLALKSPGVLAGMGPIYIILSVSQFAANTRRLHDIGKSGWWQFVPVYNLYLYVKPGTEKNSASTEADYVNC